MSGIELSGGLEASVSSQDIAGASGSLSSQCSDTTSITEHLKKVGIASPAPTGTGDQLANLSRKQRRHLDFLRSKFDFAEEKALTETRGMTRKRKSRSAACRSAKKARARSVAEGGSGVVGKRTESVHRPPTRPPTQATARGAVGQGGAPAATVSAPLARSESVRAPTAKRSPPKPTITVAQALLCRRVGIIGRRPFNEGEASRIKDAIVEVVCKRKSELPPEFHGMVLRNGQLIATVSDIESELWLLTYQDDIAEESGCELTVVRDEDIPNTQIFKGVFCHSADKDDSKILDTLEAYTRHFTLKASTWQVTRRVNDGDSAILFLSVDDESADYIRSKNGLLPYRIGHARMIRVGNEDGGQPGSSKQGEAEPPAPSQFPALPAPSGKAPLVPTAPPIVTLSMPVANAPKSTSRKARKTKGQQTLQETLRRSARAKSENST